MGKEAGKFVRLHHKQKKAVGLRTNRNLISGELSRTRTCDPLVKSAVNAFEIWRLPIITNILYGRDLGYRITRVKLKPEIEGISARQIGPTFSIVRN